MKEKITLTLTSVIHFLVDLTCIYYMNGVLFPMAVTSRMFLTWAVYYNFCAFALPTLVGYLADRVLPDSGGMRELSGYDRHHAKSPGSFRLLLAAAGCLLVGIGWFFFRIPVLMITLIGIGNGMFHVGAGMEVLHDSDSRFAPPGMFIATGAVGVFLGTTWGKQFLPLWNTFIIVMFMSAAVLTLWSFLMNFIQEQDSNNLQASISSKQSVHKKSMKISAVCCLLLFFVVFIRSYYGGLTNYTWKTGFTIGLIFTLCVAGGKFCGGILADMIGIRKAVILSLGAAGLTALLSFKTPIAGCASIYFFNMTMPLTLSLLVDLMPRYSGFAFGLLMLALFLGTLPGMLLGLTSFATPAGLLFLCLLSIAILLIELYITKKA
ncbi:MAG: hypothetical protein J6D53_01515 [Blautia sp.]|nr:hypothetical protein [Blautia sp.]